MLIKLKYMILQGRLKVRETNLDSSQSIDISNLPDNLYLIQIKKRESVFYLKVMLREVILGNLRFVSCSLRVHWSCAPTTGKNLPHTNGNSYEQIIEIK